MTDYWTGRSANAEADSGETGAGVAEMIFLAAMMLTQSCASVQKGGESVQELFDDSVANGEIDTSTAAYLHSTALPHIQEH